MAMQPRHILKPFPQELLWNANPAAPSCPQGATLSNSSGASPPAGRWNYLPLRSSKAPEPQGGTSATPSCSTTPQVFNALPPLPFLWHHRELDEPCQPLQRWNPALGLLLLLLSLKWTELSRKQLNNGHQHSRCCIFSNIQSNPLRPQDPPNEAI